MRQIILRTDRNGCGSISGLVASRKADRPASKKHRCYSKDLIARIAPIPS